MKSLLLILFLLSYNIVSAQKINYKDLSVFSKLNTDESAEILFAKDFILSNASSYIWDEKRFQFKSGDEEIEIAFKNYKEGEIVIQSCFGKKFDNDFKLLEGQVKAKSKKIRFFFYEGVHIYLTEYKLGDNYLYFGRGICTTIKTEFKQGTFIISNKRYE